RDSENILDLLKELALKGKLLFVVIHQPSSDIFKMFDRLIILDTGGHLIYNGNPIESIVYFKTRIHHANYNESECHVCGNVNPEQIFNIVEARVLDEYGQPTSTRKVSPKEWSDYYANFLLDKEDRLDEGKGIPEINFKTPNRFKQLVVFTKRDVLSKIADTQYLIITLLEAPVLAFFLAILIKYFDSSVSDAGYTLYDNENLPVYIFMSVIVAIFMGLTVSAEEIIKDRKILKREAFLNLSWNSYLMSKVSVQFVISAIQALTFVIVGNSITEIRGMWFQYWLVLFSCWASANMLGLVISDSFKAVVTIYILIPFLVIPQIILSGVMVRFEKLNPNIPFQSPVSIPFYGEGIVARWGYEALAVEQFINNKYERQFYKYDKDISQAQYIKDYWCSEIVARLDNIDNNIDQAEKAEDYNKDLNVVKNEINKQIKINPDNLFIYADSFTPDKITHEAVKAAKEYSDRVKKIYVKQYVTAVNIKDNLKQKANSADSEAFRKLSDQYTNKKLEEFVKSKNETKQIIEYNGELVQKMDPIFKDPENKFIKAHFYAPKKLIFGLAVDTYVVNVFVLWIMTGMLYLILYFRLLKKLLDSGELFAGKSKKGE
ncbi:MAG: ABC transporter, partial [Odoribacter sp.]|nr:ABC transporter [Odoribacter sp.]